MAPLGADKNAPINVINSDNNAISDTNSDVRRILHNCDPECDSQGCYGKGPTQCVSCKHYRLDK